MSLIEVWVLYALLGVAAFSAAFVWAVRTRQFTELDRQRYIALKAAQAIEDRRSERLPSRFDRYTWIVLVVVAFVIMMVALFIGIRGA